MKFRNRLILFLALAWAGTANTIFQLDRDACTHTCGTGPFAIITLSQTSLTMVTVTEVLSPNEVFAGTGAGEALEFNVAGIPVIGNITSGFAVGPTHSHASAFGEFLLSVTCTVCKGGKDSNPSGPLSFTVSSVEGISIADFVRNDRGYYFASDIRGNNGNTGNVATSSVFLAPNAAEAPEPVSLILIGAGLIGLSLMHRRHGG